MTAASFPTQKPLGRLRRYMASVVIAISLGSAASAEEPTETNCYAESANVGIALDYYYNLETEIGSFTLHVGVDSASRGGRSNGLRLSMTAGGISDVEMRGVGIKKHDYMVHLILQGGAATMAADAPADATLLIRIAFMNGDFSEIRRPVRDIGLGFDGELYLSHEVLSGHRVQQQSLTVWFLTELWRQGSVTVTASIDEAPDQRHVMRIDAATLSAAFAQLPQEIAAMKTHCYSPYIDGRWMAW